jgi:hypothetical protein
MPIRSHLADSSGGGRELRPDWSAPIELVAGQSGKCSAATDPWIGSMFFVLRRKE